MKIDLEIQDLIQNNLLVEMFDILPTAYLLTPNSKCEMTYFKQRFTDLHIGKGLSLGENMPEKHCK